MDSLRYAPVKTLVRAIAAREVSSLELVDACLSRIDAVNLAINAVFQVQYETARAAARRADTELAAGRVRGPLHGVPMTIKDSLDTAGVISTGGTIGRREFVPDDDATVVKRLKKAGAILLAKSNTSELTAHYETFNLVYGVTSNPWDITRTAGGSSGGSAAIVAAGGAPFDIGSDFGGSIRVPAHFCGVCGIKPTAGRVPRSGHVRPFGGVQDIFQQLGPIARSVDDLEMLLALISGPDHIDPGVFEMPLRPSDAVDPASLRVAMFTDNDVMSPTAETAAAVRDAGDALREAGAQVRELLPPGTTESFDVGQELWAHAGSHPARRALQRWGTVEHTLGPLDAAGIDAAALVDLMERWWSLRSRMLGTFADVDVILCPVTPAPAPAHDTVRGNVAERFFSYTQAYNVTGWPAAAVPVAVSKGGLPIGVQVVAAPAREDRVLAVARIIERAFGPARRPPL